jgi:ribonuclease D
MAAQRKYPEELRERAVKMVCEVRELWTVRDQIAQAADLSPRRVLPDSAIIEAARSLAANHAQLSQISGFRRPSGPAAQEGLAGGRREGADIAAGT